jgi:hypothetical protein
MDIALDNNNNNNNNNTPPQMGKPLETGRLGRIVALAS